MNRIVFWCWKGIIIRYVFFDSQGLKRCSINRAKYGHIDVGTENCGEITRYFSFVLSQKRKLCVCEMMGRREGVDGGYVVQVGLAQLRQQNKSVIWQALLKAFQLSRFSWRYGKTEKPPARERWRGEMRDELLSSFYTILYCTILRFIFLSLLVVI